MSERTAALDSKDWSALVDELNALRLARDWSYRELAADVARVTGLAISFQTLQPLLAKPAAERAKPYDRTIHKIRLYLASVLNDSQPAAASLEEQR